MFLVAISIGIYSYLVYFIGLFGLLHTQNLFLISITYLCFVFYLFKKKINNLQKLLENFKKLKKDRLTNIFILTIISQAGVNLIGVLGPELGFDALWYHLTIPKIYLENHSVFYIPGGLLYYSAMPKLIEMVYVAGLAFGDEVFPKLIHFFFGILSLIALCKLSLKFF